MRKAEYMSGRLCKVPGITCRKIDEEVIIVNNECTKMLTLNSTAASIWELCDGTMSVEDIANKMEDQYNADGEVIRNDVVEVVAGLIAKGYLKESSEW